MKTTVKHLATATFITILLLISTFSKAETTESALTGMECQESALTLEDWMQNEKIWETKPETTVEFIQETDSRLTLEEWMISAESWKIQPIPEAETEIALTLENWMTDAATWKIKHRVHNHK